MLYYHTRMISSVPTVADIRTINGSGPWSTKSGGELNVLFAIGYDDMMNRYFQYSKDELDTISYDIRGLRSYKVSGLEAGVVGANEWHKVRQELVFTLKGAVRWVCEDLSGKTREFLLEQDQGIWIPSHILHTYTATTQSEILVVANTLFIPDNPQTHDTYPAKSFHQHRVENIAQIE